MRGALGWSLGVIALGLFVALVGPGASMDLPGRFDSPSLALDMSANLDEVRTIVPTINADFVRTWQLFLLADVAFLLAYGVLYFRLAKLGQARGDRWGRLAALGKVTSPLTAVLDFFENISISLALRGSATAAAWIQPISLAKWGCLGLTAFVIAFVFVETRPIDSERKLLRVATTFFYLSAAVIAAFGFLDHTLLERVPAALGAALVTQTLSFLYPHTSSPPHFQPPV